jgi:prepilin-type processing-associated H-X9-DG protein
MKRPASHAGVKAFTRIELVVIVLVLGLIAGFLILSRIQTASKSRNEACLNNLKEVGIAFRLWPPDQLITYPMQTSKDRGGTSELIGTGQVFVHFRALSNELRSPKILVCPADKQKTVATNFGEGFSDANLSYFLGLDASEVWPQSLLAGDRNLAAAGRPLEKGLFVLTTNVLLSWTKNIHNGHGNICYGDGSARFLTSDGLAQVVQVGFAQAVQMQTPTTNRLVLP